MSRRFLGPIVPLVLLLVVASASSPAAAAVEAILQVAAAPSAVGCSRSAAAAAQVVVESCTDDIVRSFFGVRGSDVCCRALGAVGGGCYRAVFSGSPFVDIYATILAQGTSTGAEKVRNSALAKNWSEYTKIHKAVRTKCFSSSITPTKFEVGMAKSLEKEHFHDYQNYCNLNLYISWRITIEQHGSSLEVELMNEPLAPGTSLASLTKYYRDGYHAVRRHSSTAYVVMSNQIGIGENTTELLDFPGRLPGGILDVHYYTVFNSIFNNPTVEQNIDFDRTNFSGELAKVTTRNGPLTFVVKC